MGVIAEKVKETLNNAAHSIGLLEYVNEYGRPIKKRGDNMSGKQNKVVKKGNKVVLQRPDQPDQTLRETSRPVRQPKPRVQRISRAVPRISARTPKLR